MSFNAWRLTIHYWLFLLKKSCLRLLGIPFCLMGRHKFEPVELEWDWVILECSCCHKPRSFQLPKRNK